MDRNAEYKRYSYQIVFTNLLLSISSSFVMISTSTKYGFLLKSSAVAVMIASCISNLIGSILTTSISIGWTIHLGSFSITVKTSSSDVENRFFPNKNLISARTIVGIISVESSSKNTLFAVHIL